VPSRCRPRPHFWLLSEQYFPEGLVRVLSPLRTHPRSCLPFGFAIQESEQFMPKGGLPNPPPDLRYGIPFPFIFPWSLLDSALSDGGFSADVPPPPFFFFHTPPETVELGLCLSPSPGCSSCGIGMDLVHGFSTTGDGPELAVGTCF